MAKNYLLCVLALLCAGLGIHTIRAHRQMADLQQQIAQLEVSAAAALKPPPPSPPPAPATLPSPVSDLPPAETIEDLLPSTSGPPDESEELLQDANKLIDMLVEENEAVKKEAENSPFARMKKMMQSKDMEDMMRSQMSAQVAKMYEGLGARLELSEDLDASFTELLEERMLNQARRGMDMFGKSPEEMEAYAMQMQKEEEAFQATFKELLGESGYEAFQKWEKQLPRRQTLQQVAASMGNKAFSDEQQETLLELMLRRDEEMSGPGIGDVKPGTMPNSKQIEAMMIRQQKLNELYIQDAQVVLDEEQHEAFAKGLENQLKMQELGMKMGARMLGTDIAPESDN